VFPFLSLVRDTRVGRQSATAAAPITAWAFRAARRVAAHISRAEVTAMNVTPLGEESVCGARHESHPRPASRAASARAHPIFPDDSLDR
jgi:hypothetical protein